MKQNELLQIIRNGGATLDNTGAPVSFSDGFQVSKKDCYTLEVANVRKILRAINKLLDSISAGDFVGVWVDSGLVYVDISERIQDEREALRVGRERGQISIYNWQTGACVFC